MADQLDERDELSSLDDGRAAAHESEIDLVRRAAAGERAAREALMDKLACLPALLRYWHRRMGVPLDQDDLADAEQETLTSLWSKLESFEGRCSLKTWASRFALLEVRKCLARKRRSQEWTASGEALEHRPDSGDEARVDLPAVLASLQRLGPPSAEVIALRHFEELDFEQIAARLGSTPSSARNHYYRGIARLREILLPLGRRIHT